MADFFKIAPHNGAMNYFDSAVGNDILSVHYKIGGGLQKLRGKCINFLCKMVYECFFADYKYHNFT